MVDLKTNLFPLLLNVFCIYTWACKASVTLTTASLDSSTDEMAISLGMDEKRMLAACWCPSQPHLPVVHARNGHCDELG